MQKDTHFNKIFWFLSALVGFACFYEYKITFYPVPKDSVRFADSFSAFLMGTIIGGALGYLITGSPQNLLKPKDTPPAGTTHAEITANITAENTDNQETK